MEADEIQALIEDGIAGRRAVQSIVEVLLDEMSRGGRNLIVDENRLDLEDALWELGYTVYHVEPSGLLDDEIKTKLRNKVFITENGSDFCNQEDIVKYHYGLIWIKAQEDAKLLAQKIAGILMAHNFKKNVCQCVKMIE